MSSDAGVKWGSIGASFSLCIKSLEFSVLNALGRRVRWPAFCVSSLASLYVGVLRQFTTGRMGWSGLCSFIRPLMVGAEGFMLMYFHLVSCGMSVLLLCIVFQIWAWYVFVGSVDMVWNWFAHVGSCVLWICIVELVK